MRKVHLRTATVINLGHTRTYCGKVIHGVGYPIDLSAAVNTFGGSNGEFDATVHGTLVTCERCIEGTYHVRPAIAAATQRAKTAKRVECEASQSGPSGHRPNYIAQ